MEAATEATALMEAAAAAAAAAPAVVAPAVVAPAVAAPAVAAPAPPPEPPDAFVCPITQELMDEPVMAFDGHTYERRAIERWFKRRQTSPKTGEQLANAVLLPNHAMRGQIIEWREQHKVAHSRANTQP